MRSSLAQFSLAFRRLRRAPAFALAASITLALGIGATTAVFSVVNGVLLRPLPYERSDRLVDLTHTLTISGVSSIDQSDATYLYYRRANSVFTDVAAYRVASVNLGGVSVGADARAERVAAGRVSASMFRVLGVPALHGRALTDADDQQTAPRVVLLGQRLWERKFGGDPSIVGRALMVDGVPRDVVGIMPARFRLPSDRTDLWVPLALDPAHTATAAFDYRGIARLRDGVTLAAATTDLQRLLPRVPEAFPGRLTAASIQQIHMQAVVRPLRDVVVGNVGRVLWVVLGAVGCVLLVACANVMNLFLVRFEGRQHEMAVRRALGAGRSALVMEFLSEAVVLATVGGVMAVALAVAGVRVLRSLEGEIDIPRIGDIGVDATVLAVAAGVTLLAAIIVSVLPALRSGSLGVAGMLADSGRAMTAGRRRHRVRHALVVAQLALALVLLAGAGLMARSFERLRSVPAGFDAERAFVVRVALPTAGYAAPGDAARYVGRAVDAVAAIPGVQSAAAVSKLPLVAESRRDTALFVEDRPLEPGTMPALHQVVFASDAYFKTLGIPLLDGRTFERPDADRASHEIILSRSVAERYWPGVSAIGKRVRTAPRGVWYTVVGVAGDVRGTALEQPPDEILYLPLVVQLGDAGQPAPEVRWTPAEVAFAARSSGDAAAIVTRVEAAIRAIDPGVPTYSARLMTDVVSQAAARTTFTLVLLGIASAVAMVLGAVGIYGVISYVVSLRSREIAIRLALGAQPSDVRRMVTKQAVAVAAVGIGVGVIAAVVGMRALSALLFEVSPTDPVSLAVAVGSLFVVALAASWVPAARAAAVDPAHALRD
ncbi:MAG TPA: ABC transporter permease [Gemmatimonadaceae bacterium]|nr:ABC transporter permease [Gemmatimonadaceae bacterium]